MAHTQQQNAPCTQANNAAHSIALIDNLACQFWTSPRGLMEHLRHSQEASAWYMQTNDKRPTRNILVFFHALGIGGGERVTCALAEIWQSLGMNVTIVTDLPVDQNQPHQDIPAGVGHRVIPDYNHLTGETYPARSRALSEIIEETDADTMVFAHWFADSLPFDLLTCKAYGLKTYLFIQSLFTLFFLDDLRPQLVDMPCCYELADGVVCLNDTDRFVWSQFNPNTFVTQNPITMPPQQAAAPLEGHAIIWPARLHPDKCPERVIPIMQELLTMAPDAMLHMVGPVDEPYKTEFLQLARQSHVEHAITLHGEQSPEQMDGFYRDADAFLLTSRREGWSLALAEAMSHGLPCVMYALPYLSLTRDNPAVIQIEQDDARSAAAALAKVLTDKEYARALGASEQAFLCNMATYDHRVFWSELFGSKKASDVSTRVSDPASIAIHEAFSAHGEYIAHQRAIRDLIFAQKDTHIRNLESINGSLTSRCEGLSKEIEAIRNSRSFKLGRAITAVPRMLRNLLRHSS